MKKLLFVDLFCPDGHINLNRNYLELFSSYGFEITCALKEGYIEKLGLNPQLVKLSIPSFFFDEGLGSIACRYYQFKMLRILKRTFNLKAYDYIFFSSYDEISLFFSFIRGPLILVNHGNISGLDNRIKRWLHSKVSKRAFKEVVFHDFIKKRCEYFGLKKVEVEPLGLYRPYLRSNNAKLLLKKIDNRLVSPAYKYAIFIPSASKYASSFVNKLLEDKSFLDFLEWKKILLVIKGGSVNSPSQNILNITRYLSNEEYVNLFLASSMILLSYPSSFNYRVSAILFECFSNNKACLLSDIEGFMAFGEHFNYNPFFNDANTLVKTIDTVITSGILAREEVYKNLKQLNPRFDWLLP